MTQPINSPQPRGTTAVARVVPEHLRQPGAAAVTDAYVARTERFDGVPAEPPADVLAEVSAAFDRLDALHADGLSLRFDTADDGAPQFSVVGDDGELRRRVGAAEAMGIATGTRPAVPDERPQDADVPFTFDREA